MSAQGPVSGWAPEVVDFLSNNLPRHVDSEEWDHMFSTAYQFGCEALVALGYAKETDGGAMPLVNPMFPSSLPRWDDICIAVLVLAEQQNKLSYCLADGTKQPPRVSSLGFALVQPADQRHSLAPNIAAKGAMGPANADLDIQPVLLAMGMIEDGHWTDHAETVLWRKQPSAWDLDISTDPRFVKAVQETVNTLPCDIRKEIDKLVVISDEDIEASVSEYKTAIEKLRFKHGPQARIGRLETPEETRLGLAFKRRSELDWVFFRRWRLPDGWLSTKQAESALELFHDPLAKQMRRAVVDRLHPDKHEFSKR